MLMSLMSPLLLKFLCLLALLLYLQLLYLHSIQEFIHQVIPIDLKRDYNYSITLLLRHKYLHMDMLQLNSLLMQCHELWLSHRL